MKSAFYFLLLVLFATALGFLFYNNYRPQIVERGCAEIAAQSSDLIFNNKKPNDPTYEYENVKQRCLEDSLKK